MQKRGLWGVLLLLSGCAGSSGSSADRGSSPPAPSPAVSSPPATSTSSGRSSAAAPSATTAAPNAASIDERLLFHPVKHPRGRWRSKPSFCDDAAFSSLDNTRLHGWYCSHDAARAVVLYLHGNGGNVSYASRRLRMLHDRVKATVLAVDYRGYGRSEGQPTVAGVLADARAARAFLASKAGVATHDVVLLGRSLGGALAIQLAATERARGLVVDSSFTSLRDAARHHVGWLLSKAVPSDRLDSLTAIASHRGPLLIVHGTADTIVPFAHGQKLFEAANEPKRFVELPGVDHNDLPGEARWRELSAFVEQLPRLQRNLESGH